MEEAYNTQVLPNGVRIVTEHVPSVRSASLGIWVGTGSRSEKPGEGGAAHFIEHMVFKGTERRTARQLAQEMDAIGGQVNAYTTKAVCLLYTSPDQRIPGEPERTAPTVRPAPRAHPDGGGAGPL